MNPWVYFSMSLNNDTFSVFLRNSRYLIIICARVSVLFDFSLVCLGWNFSFSLPDSSLLSFTWKGVGKIAWCFLTRWFFILCLDTARAEKRIIFQFAQLMRFSDFCDGKTGVGKLAKDACAVEKKWFHCEHYFPHSIAVQMIQRGIYGQHWAGIFFAKEKNLG